MHCSRLRPFVGRAWSTRPVLALLVTLVAGAVLSAFMNNTPIVVLLMPILVGASLRSKFPVSGVMLPMGLATIVGGMSTTIGTSTNLLVVGIANDLDPNHQFTMFEWVWPVTIVGGVAILFLWLVAPRLIPDRAPPMADTSPRVFSAQLHIKEGGASDGKTLSEVLAKADGLRIDKIQRSDSLFLAKLPSVVLLPGDRLFVKDSPENLKHYEQVLGATLFNLTDLEHPINEETPLRAEGQQLAEVVVTRGSPLHLRSLAAARFSASYGLLPLGLHRARAPSSQVTGDLNMIRLRAGDVLLVQGSGEAISTLKDSGSMLVLDGTTDLPHTHNAKRALAIMAFVVAAAALGIMPISVSAMVGLGLMIVTGCLNWSDASSALSIPVVMIIVTALALGKALMGTGMADWIAISFVGGCLRPADADDTECIPAADDHNDQCRIEQCGGGDRHADRHQHCGTAGRQPRALYPGRTVRRQHEFRDAIRLPDQPADPERRWLQVHRLPAGRHTADGHHVDRLLARAADALHPLKKVRKGSEPFSDHKWQQVSVVTIDLPAWGPEILAP